MNCYKKQSNIKRKIQEGQIKMIKSDNIVLNIINLTKISYK